MMATVDRATITGIANDRGSSDGEFITNDADNDLRQFGR